MRERPQDFAVRPRWRAAGLLAAILTSGGIVTARQAPGEHVRIALVGDSTVAEGGGWGPGFRASFGRDVEVLNFAQNGRSSKSYRAEGFWEPALAARPHYVLIQFGHNDNPGKGPDRETDPATTYRANLTRYLDEARAAGAIPVLVTSIVRRNLTEDGRVKSDANLPYVDEVRRLGAERHVLVMDLYELTRLQCERLAAAGCNALGATTAAGALDTTHLSAIGQKEVGAIAAAEFVRVVLPGSPSIDPKTINANRLMPLNRARSTFPMPEPRDPRLPSLVLVGDSTVRNGQGDGAGGLWGWGDALPDYLDTSTFNIVNRAIGGLSSRTYVTFGHWDRALALLKAGDVLVMQFGHNDASAVNDPTRARGTLPGAGNEMSVIDNQMTGEREEVHSYGWYLRRMIGDAQKKQVSVVVCSPVPRNAWKDGTVVRSETYRPWAEQVAKASGAGFVDLNGLVAVRYEALGRSAVAPFFPADDTHTSRAGAEVTAATAAAALEATPGHPWLVRRMPGP
jgi:lysophospholipase L1-like esterase